MLKLIRSRQSKLLAFVEFVKKNWKQNCVTKNFCRVAKLYTFQHNIQQTISRIVHCYTVNDIEHCTEINGFPIIENNLVPKFRINISQKTDLVMREIEDMQMALEKFIRRSHRIKCSLKAEIEETTIRDTELTLARESFEQAVCVDGVNPITQRIPAEKWVQWMQQWLKDVQLMLEKLRLRTSSLCTQFSKLKNVLARKEELGESVHEVDFEKLSIENQHFVEKYDQKNHHLIELKRMNGKSNLILSTYKKYLQKQTEEINHLQEVIATTKESVVSLQKEAEMSEVEVVQSNETLEQIKEMISNYNVPETIEYISSKSEMYDVKKNIKIWERRKHIQKMMLDAHTRKMKRITGLNRAKESWYELKDPTYYEEYELIDENFLKTIHLKKTVQLSSDSDSD